MGDMNIKTLVFQDWLDNGIYQPLRRSSRWCVFSSNRCYDKTVFGRLRRQLCFFLCHGLHAVGVEDTNFQQ